MNQDIIWTCPVCKELKILNYKKHRCPKCELDVCIDCLDHSSHDHKFFSGVEKQSKIKRKVLSNMGKKKGKNNIFSIPIVKIGTIVFVLLLSLSVVTSSIKIVGAGNRGILLSWGKVEDRILGEGLTFVTPYMQTVVEMSVQAQKYSGTASSASKDLQDVSTQVALNYHLDANRINKIYQNLGIGYEDKIIQPAIQEGVKSSTAQYTAEELITKRPTVKLTIENFLNDRLKGNGIIVEVVSITDFQFSQQFTQAIESKVTAVQSALKAENDLKRIQIEAQQKIAESEGIATSTLTRAKAEAQSITIQSEALRENKDILQLRWIEKWNGQLPQVTGNTANLLNIPLDISNQKSNLE